MLNRLLDWCLKKEPALATATLVNLVGSTAGLLALWGLSVSQQTQTAMISTISTLVPAIYGVAVVIRQLVTPVPKAEAAIADALHTSPAYDAPASTATTAVKNRHFRNIDTQVRDILKDAKA